MKRLRIASAGLLLPLLLVASCAPHTAQLLDRSEGTTPVRQYQNRQFETADEARVLAVCSLLLQDMGFQIDEGSIALGVLSASKMRDANRLTPEQRFGASVLFWGLLIGGYTAPLALFLMGADSARPMHIEVGIVTRTIDREGGRVSVDVVFKENSAPVAEPALYQAFFGQLSKALFMEARES